jgi:peptide/nickel transport system substrate-binding protein
MSAIPPGSWAHAKEYDRTEQDLPTAKRLLEEAGWLPHPTSRILIREGQEFRFTIRTDNDPQRLAAANEIARELEALGIRANVASTTFSVLLRDFLQERKYDAAIAGWDQGPDPDPYSSWHSSQMGAAGLNIGNFADPVVDELISFGRTRTDLEVRKDAYRQFQEKWEELVPGVVLAYPRYTYIRRSSFDGELPAVLTTPSHRFADIHRWKP